jgi:two-component system OmpR family response regulator
VNNPQRSLTRAEVLQLAPPRPARDSGRSVDVTISRLRRKIERNARKPALIKTVRNKGYFFTAAIPGAVSKTLSP